MDKRVFRKYMNEEIVQKTIIFADVFGLSIDKWKPAKEDSKFPYRIYLYEKNNIVGYLDVDKGKYGGEYIYVNRYPIVLYTPIGNVEGYYKDWSFKYQMEEPNSDVITEMSGFFGIEKQISQSNYGIKGYVSFKSNTEDSYIVSFNNCIKYGTLCLSKNNDLDTLSFNINNSLSISYKTNVVGGNYKDINNISVTTNTPSTVLGVFRFNDFPPYEKDITIENPDNGRQKLDTLVDLEKLNIEITNHDPRIFEFLDEVRELLSIPSSKGTISIYDKLAFHSFNNDKSRIKQSLIRNKNVSEKLKKNPVLQKMANYNKRNCNN